MFNKMLLALLLFAVLVSCEPRVMPSKAKDDPFLTAPTHISYGIDILLSDSSFVKAHITADVGILREDRQQTCLSGNVVVDFYRKDYSARAARLTADSVVIEDRTKDMTAFGNVVVRADSVRTTLKTPRLNWIHTTQRIQSNEKVVVITPAETIHGTGFESDQYLTHYKIFKVTGEHRP